MFNFGPDFRWTAEGQEFDRALDQMQFRRVKVGYDESSGSYPDGTPVADVAAYNEFGTDSIPARPFLRQALENQNESLFGDIASSLWAGLTGGGVDAFYEHMGEKAKQAIQDSIDSGNFEPDAPSTVEQKGSSQPLIDTGLLRDSVRVTIEGK